MSITNLPVELLYEIHLYALCSSLPYVSRHTFYAFYGCLAKYRATYLLHLLHDYAYPQRRIRTTISQKDRRSHKPQFIHRALRYPICTVPVLEAMFRHPLCPPADVIKREEVDLPRRFFRDMKPSRRKPANGDPVWSEYDPPLPFLRYLFNEPAPLPTHSSQPSLRAALVAQQNETFVPHLIRNINVNAYDGYPLSRAVYCGFVPLVRFLLAHGADPTLKKNLPILLAIQRRDLALVKMLIENVDDRTTAAVATEPGEDKGEPMAKRRKLEDRVRPNADMMEAAVKANARDIIDYLLSRGGIPDVKTLRMVSQQHGSGPRK